MFLHWWKPYSIILSKEAAFSYSGNVFFNECFIPGSGNGFSGQEKTISFFSVQWKRNFNKSFIPAIGAGFPLQWKPSPLLESPFSLAKTINEWKPFLKHRPSSCQWKLVFQLVETIFFQCLRCCSRSSSSASSFFGPEEKVLLFILNFFFLLVNTII